MFNVPWSLRTEWGFTDYALEVQPVYDTKSVIYRNGAAKVKAWSKICKAPKLCTEPSPIVGGGQAQVHSKKKKKL